MRCHYCLSLLRGGGLQCVECEARQTFENNRAADILANRPWLVEQVLTRMIEDHRKGDQEKRPSTDIAYLIAARDQSRKANHEKAKTPTAA